MTSLLTARWPRTLAVLGAVAVVGAVGGPAGADDLLPPSAVATPPTETSLTAPPATGSDGSPTSTSAPHSPVELPSVATATVADPVTIETGHVDVISVRPDGAELRLEVKDDSSGGAVVWRDPAAVRFLVREGAAATVPAPDAFRFLGTPGSRVWLLPQVQDPDLVWPGWNTEQVPRGMVVGDALRVRLVDVRGPGAVAVFTTDSFGGPRVLFDSDDGLPDELVVPVGVHAHGNWAFDAEGTYDLTVEVDAVLAVGGPRTLRATYRFDVVRPTPSAPPVPPTTVVSGPAAGAAASGAAGPAGSAPVAGAAGAAGAAGPAGVGGQAPSAAAAAEAAAATGLPPAGATSGPLAALGGSLVVAGLLLVRAGRRRAASLLPIPGGPS